MGLRQFPSFLYRWGGAVAGIALVGAWVAYVPALALPWLAPDRWWPMGLLGIGFAPLWLCLLALTIVALLCRWRWMAALSGGLLLAGLPLLRPMVGWNSGAWQDAKPAGALRIMQWNANGPPGSYEAIAKDVAQRALAVAFIRRYQPDVLLVQDFTDFTGQRLWSNLALIRDSLHYPYLHFAIHSEVHYAWGHEYQGTLIASRLPLENRGHLAFGGRPYPELVPWADVRWQGRPLRLLSAHLYSMNLNTPRGEPNTLNYTQMPDSAIIRSGSLTTKLAYYTPYHARQARQLRTLLEASPHPVVLGADLNSVPTSWVYRHLAAGFTDAHLAAGRGTGATYPNHRPLLRIDYQLAHPNLKPVQVRQFAASGFGDHAPVLADWVWR